MFRVSWSVIFSSTRHISRNLSHFRKTTLRKGVYTCPRYPAQIYLRLIQSHFQSVRLFPSEVCTTNQAKKSSEVPRTKSASQQTHADLKTATMWCKIILRPYAYAEVLLYMTVLCIYITFIPIVKCNVWRLLCLFWQNNRTNVRLVPDKMQYIYIYIF